MTKHAAFGKVINMGPKTLKNMEMRSVLKFMRRGHPEWGKIQMSEELGYSLSFVKDGGITMKLKIKPERVGLELQELRKS